MWEKVKRDETEIWWEKLCLHNRVINLYWEALEWTKQIRVTNNETQTKFPNHTINLWIFLSIYFSF